jgi:hypothetical protein
MLSYQGIQSRGKIQSALEIGWHSMGALDSLEFAACKTHGSFCNNTNRQINNVLEKEKKRELAAGEQKEEEEWCCCYPPTKTKKKQALEGGIDHRLIWNM